MATALTAAPDQAGFVRPQPPAIAGAPGTPEPSSSGHAFHEMRLKIGDPLQIEPPRQMSAGRADAKLIGYLEGHSLIVTAPRNPTGRLALRDGEQVLVRTFTGKRAYAFKSKVLKVAHLPFEHLHLGFPAQIESVGVRSSPRYRVRFPASIAPSGSKPAIPVVIENIGTTGAMVEAAERLGNNGDHVALEFELTLHGVRASLSLLAVLRSATSETEEPRPPRWLHGVQFEGLEDKDRLILGSLVWYQMYEHPRTVV